MIKNSLVYVAGECSSFLARRLGLPSRFLPRASTRQQESTPGITILPATQAGKFTSLRGYFHPLANNLLWTRIAIIRHNYWIQLVVQFYSWF